MGRVRTLRDAGRPRGAQLELTPTPPRGALTSTQRDVYLDQERHRDLPIYSIGCSVDLGRDLDRARWEEAVRAVFAAEPLARTRIEETPDGLFQFVDPRARPRTGFEDGVADDRDAVRAALGAHLQEPPAGADEAPFREWLVRTSAGEYHSALGAPHLLSDGHTYRLFFERVGRCYEALAAGRPLPDLSGPTFYDYLREAPPADAPATCEAWRERLRGAGPLHFRTRREVPGRYASERLALTPAESDALGAYCRARGIGLPTLLLSLYALVLQRYREPGGDWVLHAIRGARPPRFRDTMGCFFQVVPYRLPEERLARSARLADLFAYLRDYRRDPRLRGEISMLRLQECLPSGGCRVVFNSYDFDRVPVLGRERSLEVYFSHPPNEAHLVVGSRDGALELRHFFHTSHLRGETVLARVRRLALQVAGGAERVSDLDWLLDDERPPARAPRPAAEAAPERPVHELFEEQAARRPDAIALVDGERRWSYGELNAFANRLARLLVREGVGPDVLVALRLERSAAQVAAILAVLKAGGAYVPIDPDYPEARARFILEDSAPGLLVTEGGGVDDAGPRTLRLAEAADRIAAEDAANLPPRAAPGDLAYVIYTSGSTGRPKGVTVTRHNVARLFAVTKDLFRFAETDVWPLLHSYAFDFSVWEMWGALAFGGRLVVVPACVVRSPEDLHALLVKEGVTVLNQTPSAFYRFLEAEPGTGPADALRLVVFGGEALDVARLKPWFDRHGDETPALVNMFGITETTVHVTWRRLSKGDAAPGAPSLIGRPLPDLRVHLVDAEGSLVPRGVAGEGWIAGAGVARGYLGRDELTAQRFLEDPFDPGGGRVYRSGDLLRELSGGELEYLGRVDTQVQIRGYRVEPGEVEGALRQHPGVADAAVVVHPDPAGEPSLTAWVVPKEGADVREAELREFLRARLPSYMLCARYGFLSAMPLTAHGKVDRAALPAPGAGRPELDTGYAPPRTQTEELLAGLFGEATGVERVGIHDDFFALGGNSLSATQVVASVRRLLGVEVPLHAIFQAPTVAALSEAIAARRFAEGADARPLVVPSGAGDAPLTFAQERVWLIQQLHPDAVAYHFEAAVRFRGPLRDDLLERSLEELVARHEVLRTTFPKVEGRPVQRVHREGVVALERVDLTHLPEGEARAHVERWRRDTASEPFALDRLPLVRWWLFRLSEQDHVLVHREHHLLHDGWSFVVFLGELLRAYAARLEGRPSPLAPLPLRLADLARAERTWMEGPAAERQLAYWRERLAGAPSSLDLPCDFARPPRPSYRGESFRLDLPPEVVRSLRALAKESGVTLFSTMLGAFALLLSRIAGEPELCLGSGVANRRPETEGILGMVLNNVVLRLAPAPALPLGGFLREAQRTVFEALAHGDVPFDRVVRLVRPEPGPGAAAAVCPVFFSSYEGPIPRVPIPGLAVELDAGLPNGSAKFDLNVIMVAQPAEGLTPEAGAATTERVSLIWEYSVDLFERATMERLARDYVSLLGALHGNAGRPCGDIAIGVEAEARALALGPEAPWPRDASIVDLWRAQAARTPDAIAVSDVHGAWTYREMDAVADRVAALLLRRGVRAGEVVGVCLPRGRMAVASMLGILAAGAAFLPLDPRLPERRAGWLAGDAQVRFVLTYAASRALFRERDDVEPLCLDKLSRELNREPAGRPAAAPGPLDLAYVMYTSGSTGPPKGVEVVHRGVVRLAHGLPDVRLDEKTRVLQLAPLSFDASTFEIWAVLLHGGTVVVYPEEVPDAASLARAIADERIDTMWLNASLFNTIVDHDPAALAPLEQLLIGGEALSVAHVRRAHRALPRTRIFNGYGPTENTTFSCCHPIPRDLPAAAASVPLGRPLAHGSAWVVDGNLRPLPWGAIGEIALGGDGLARGYRARPELTAERFVPDPFSETPGSRLYLSGDFGRYRSDGSLEFRGRRDDQVKIRGFRIEPAEVEWALQRLPGVGRCAVLAEGDGADRRLVAYVVPAGAALDVARLRADARLELPSHLVPQEFVLLGALPLSAHGKLDRASLPLAPRAARLPAPPRTATEEIVAGVMAEVLGLSEVGADDHFFDLGGHSLLGIELLARLSGVLGAQLPARALIESPTVAGLAALIDRANREDPGRSLVKIKPGGSKEPLFFTPGGDGADGALLVYAKLARFLDADQPFYGLRARRARDGAEPHRCVEEMAADYLRDVKQVQPHGPYFFGGECVGGVIAYEMARQALAAGDEVRLLVLLDSRPPRGASKRRHWLRYLSSRARVRLDHTFGRLDPEPPGPPTVVQSLPRLHRWLDDRLPYDAREAPPTLDLAWVAYQRTLLRYRPGPYRGRLALLLSDAYGPVSAEWERLVDGRVDVHRTPGDHDSYIRKHARETAAILAACLDEARARA